MSITSQNTRGRKLVVVAIVFVVALAPSAQAGWLSWVGATCSVAAVPVAIFVPPPKGPVIAGVLAIGQLVMLAADVVITLSQPAIAGAGTQPQPAFLEGSEGPAPVALASAFLSVEYPHLALSGDETDALIIEANQAIDRANLLVSAYNSGQSGSDLLDEISALGAEFRDMSAEYEALSVPYALTQDDVEKYQADIGANGLPSFEEDYLLNAGWSQDDVDALAQYVATAPIDLAVASVSGDDMLSYAGQLPFQPHGVPALSPVLLAALAMILAVVGASIVGRRLGRSTVMIPASR